MSQALTPEKKPQVTPYESFRGEFVKMEPAFKKALPEHISPEKFVRIVLTAVQRNPDLLNAGRDSVYAACMLAAQDGLLPDGREAAMVMFGRTCTYMPMVSGILKKIWNSGTVKSISPHCVYENEEFDRWVDEKGEHMIHKPKLSDRGNFKCVYAIAETKEGGILIEVMSIDDIEQVRNVSKNKNGGPWKDWFQEMAKKTVIRRLAKRLPISADVVELFHRDDELYELNKPRELMPYTPPQYIPGLEPKKTVEVLVMDAKEIGNPFLVTSVLDQLVAMKEIGWVEKIVAKTQEAFPDYVYPSAKAEA